MYLQNKYIQKALLCCAMSLCSWTWLAQRRSSVYELCVPCCVNESPVDSVQCTGPAKRFQRSYRCPGLEPWAHALHGLLKWICVCLCVCALGLCTCLNGCVCGFVCVCVCARVCTCLSRCGCTCVCECACVPRSMCLLSRFKVWSTHLDELINETVGTSPSVYFYTGGCCLVELRLYEKYARSVTSPIGLTMETINIWHTDGGIWMAASQ